MTHWKGSYQFGVYFGLLMPALFFLKKLLFGVFLQPLFTLIWTQTAHIPTCINSSCSNMKISEFCHSHNRMYANKLDWVVSFDNGGACLCYLSFLSPSTLLHLQFCLHLQMYIPGGGCTYFYGHYYQRYLFQPARCSDSLIRIRFVPNETVVFPNPMFCPNIHIFSGFGVSTAGINACGVRAPPVCKQM